MSFILSQLHSLFVNVGPFFILLGILIFVHELGHFAVAKFFGVRVETFSLGFGRKIFTYKKGDTTYCVSLIPLGGYVKMFGDDPSAEIPEEERRYAFLHKPIFQRFCVVLAGPMMNLFFAMFVFCFIAGLGEEVAGPIVGDVAADSRAYAEGFRSGDKILSVDGHATATWSDVQKGIENSGGRTVDVQLERDGKSEDIQAAVGFGDNENIFSPQRMVGQIPGFSQDSRLPLIGIRDPQSPAAKAGLHTLDLVLTVNGKKVNYWRELAGAMNPPPGTKTLELTVRDIDSPDKPESIRTVKLETGKLDAGKANDGGLAELGIEPSELYIYKVTKNSPAEHAGIQAKDRVVAVGGVEVKTWTDVLNRVKSFDPSQDGLEFVISRSGETKTLKIKPEMTALTNPVKGNEEHRFTIGILSGFVPVGAEPIFYRLTDPAQILKHGIAESNSWTVFTVMSLVRMVQGDVSARNLGGIITIGRVASHSFAVGLTSFLRIMGIISINLFLLNLLPVPVLDGGHLVFYTIEALQGAPLSLRKMEIAQQVGLMLLMLLMAFAFYNDISNLFSSRW